MCYRVRFITRSVKCMVTMRWVMAWLGNGYWYTCCSDRHASPYSTFIRGRISMGFAPSLLKRMRDRCSSLVHVARGAAIFALLLRRRVVTRYPLCRRLGGSQGRSGRVRKISTPTGSPSPDRPACSKSLCPSQLTRPTISNTIEGRLYKITLHFLGMNYTGVLINP